MPFGREAVVMVSVAGAIVRVRGMDLVCFGVPESCTWKVIDELDTDTVGVPEITPVDWFSDSPAGNAPPMMLHDTGGVPPVEARVLE